MPTATPTLVHYESGADECTYSVEGNCYVEWTGHPALVNCPVCKARIEAELSNSNT